MGIEVGNLAFLFFLLVGLACLVFPEKVQAFGLKRNTKFWGFPNPFLGWMKTQEYLWMLRILGFVSTLAALFVEYVTLFGKH